MRFEITTSPLFYCTLIFPFYTNYFYVGNLIPFICFLFFLKILIQHFNLGSECLRINGSWDVNEVHYYFPTVSGGGDSLMEHLFWFYLYVWWILVSWMYDYQENFII